MREGRLIRAVMLCMVLAFVLPVGCKQKGQDSSVNRADDETQTASAASIGPDTSPVRPTMDEGWCGGHGVPESVCTRCNSSLVPLFKEAGDWCDEHDLPESQCTACHPEVEARWATLNAPTDTEPTDKPEPRTDAAGASTRHEAREQQAFAVEAWCSEHGVPESVCARCDPTLIEQFKAQNDWCGGHGLPESQCTICNPEVAAKWAALRPDSTETLTDPAMGIRVERATRILTGTNDPLCQVESVRIRFIDPSILRKAGIEVERVRRRPMSATINVPAEVEFDATNLTRITSRVSGVLRDVSVQLGSVVERGDLLAALDSPALGERKSRFIERTQDLKLAQSDLQRITTIARGVRKMIEVCTPDAGATEIREALSSSPVGDAKAKLLRAHATLQLARSEASTEAGLLNQSLSSERKYQAALSALAAAEADFVAIREELSFAAQRERLVADRAVKVAQSAFDAARRGLHILGLTEEQIDAIATQPYETLSLLELRSPSAGRIIERSVTVGESVQSSDVLFVVADTSTMWLMADLYERDLVQVRVGQPVLFTVDGMPGAAFEGRIRWISSSLDDQTRTVRLRADLPNPNGLLRAKMFGTARIILHDGEEVVTVSNRAVQTDGCCQLVFIRESETVFQPRKVVLGTSANGFVEVLEGLSEGEMLASAGSFLLKTEILKGNIGAGCCDVDPGR
ncbi:MAG: efflux RND transporter periplasmic adaptor subunit [Planctomycetes bacterium]|nr:efflux RND transporter periplasmic adaptor subunit [Planctomycetota bacterium]